MRHAKRILITACVLGSLNGLYERFRASSINTYTHTHIHTYTYTHTHTHTHTHIHTYTYTHTHTNIGMDTPTGSVFVSPARQ